MNDSSRAHGAGFALAAAALFGASTPAAKVLLGQMPPLMLAGLLYLGSGLGLGAASMLRRRTRSEAALRRADAPWLGGAVLFGGVLGPALLMLGLRTTPASVSSLLLNLEGVFTALLAWFVFRENYDARIAAGMALIVAGGCALSYTSSGGLAVSWGALSIAAACACWAVDNNLTQKISATDPVQITAIKGAFAGLMNVGIALAGGSRLPSGFTVAAAMTLGLLAYGISLVLFVLSLRNIGTARTGAYFSTAPFVGAALSVTLLHEPIQWQLGIAAVLMAIGVWLHVTERHVHQHTHDRLEHTHRHVHDEHHQHEHSPDDPPGEPHVHAHVHSPLTHSHAHFPDIHHRHKHSV